MAGYPFHINPSEIEEMNAPSLYWWVKRADGRLKREQVKRH